MNKGSLTFLAFVLAFVTLAVVVPTTYFNSTDSKMWKEVIKHADEFTYDYSYRDIHTFVLKDTGDVCICKITLNDTFRSAMVVADNDIIASSLNKKMSHKAYKIFYDRIPEEDKYIPVNKQEIYNQIKNH